MESEDVFLIDWLIDGLNGWLTDCSPLGCLVQLRKVRAVGLTEQAVQKMENNRTTDMTEHMQEDKSLDMLSLLKMKRRVSLSPKELHNMNNIGLNIYHWQLQGQKRHCYFFK